MRSCGSYAAVAIDSAKNGAFFDVGSLEGGRLKIYSLAITRFVSNKAARSCARVQFQPIQEIEMSLFGARPHLPTARFITLQSA